MCVGRPAHVVGRARCEIWHGSSKTAGVPEVCSCRDLILGQRRWRSRTVRILADWSNQPAPESELVAATKGVRQGQPGAHIEGVALESQSQ